MEIIESKLKMLAMQEIETETWYAEHTAHGASRLKNSLLSTPALRKFVPWLYVEDHELGMRSYTADADRGRLYEHDHKIVTPAEEQMFMRRMEAMVRYWLAAGYVRKEK